MKLFLCGSRHEQICFLCVFKFNCCNILLYKIYTILNLPPESSLCFPSVLENAVDLVTEKTLP